jgi:hypothetical protein
LSFSNNVILDWRDFELFGFNFTSNTLMMSFSVFGTPLLANECSADDAWFQNVVHH